MATPKLRRVVGGDYADTEYEVIDRETGQTLGWVGCDDTSERPRVWAAETAQGLLLAECETRADAVNVVLHPERVGLAPRKAGIA